MKVTSYVAIIFLCVVFGCKAQKEYPHIVDITRNDNAAYYQQSNKKYAVSDSLFIGYMGTNDSITIQANAQVVFNGVTDYSPKVGYGRLLCIIQKKQAAKTMLSIQFHRAKKQVHYAVENQYNTVLIDNGLQYGSLDRELPESFTLHLYKETDRLY